MCWSRDLCVDILHWDCNTAWYIALNTSIEVITSVRNAAWRGDDVFLDCTNPRLSLRGDIAACAWRLCCVKQAAICLEIYAGDCVCILCWWSCKDYIGAHRGAVKTTLATIVGDCLREGPVKTVCWRIVCCLWLRWYNTCCWYFHFESSSLYAAVNPNFLK